jgi:hypothetical protein
MVGAPRIPHAMAGVLSQLSDTVKGMFKILFNENHTFYGSAAYLLDHFSTFNYRNLCCFILRHSSSIEKLTPHIEVYRVFLELKN